MGLTNGSTGPLMGHSDGPIGAPSMSNGSINGLDQCQMRFYGPTNDFCVIIGAQNSPVSPLIGGQCQTGPLWAVKWLVGPLMGHKENAMGH